MKHCAFGVLLFGLPGLAAPQNRTAPARPPGAVSAPVLHIPGMITNTGFAAQLGRSIQGQPLRGGRGFPVTPFLLTAPAYAPAPAYYYPVPPVVINQMFVSAPPPPPPAPPDDGPPDRPVFSGYRAPPAQPDDAPAPPASNVLKPALYLIASKNGAVQTAIAYWYEDSSLHYVGRDHLMHEIAMGQVDRDLTAQLNRERGVDFHFPD